MLKKCFCVLGNATSFPYFDGDVIGVDKGAWICLEKEIKMVAAIGDFDSISESQKKQLIEECKNTMVLNPRKDISDSEAAIEWAKQQGYQEIILVGSMSGRFDHTYVNFQLVRKYDCVLWDAQNRIFMIHPGTTGIKKENYRYVSFFACDHAILTLEGFSYPLHEYQMDSSTVLCLSNEIIDDVGLVSTTGALWCIQSNDK